MGRIADGGLRVGARLPVEKELAREFGVAVMTVRQGVGLLVQRGIVERRQGIGTFVVRAPVATTNVAVLVGDSLTVESAHFYRALMNRLRQGAAQRRWELHYYDEMNREVFSGEVVSSREKRLLWEHGRQPWHGLIELVPGQSSVIPQELAGRVASALFETASPHSDVLGDDYAFGRTAARHLLERGCQKLFFFCTHWQGHAIPGSVDALMDEARAAGVPAPAIHCRAVSHQGREVENDLYRAFRRLVRSWKKKPEVRPDGLVFNDDIALRAAMPALFREGFPVAENFQIFCLGNEDQRFRYGAPVTRYEISPQEIANHLLHSLDCRMMGRPAPPPLTPSTTIREDD